MKRRGIMNLFSLAMSLILLVTVCYAWWTGAEATGQIEITTANIASEVKIYEGIDFNRDGNLDQILDSNGKYVDSFKPDPLVKGKGDEGGKPINIALSFTDIAPTEIFTWKVEITNKGDAKGYVRAEISNDFLKENYAYLKYFSIRAVWSENGVKLLSKKRYFADMFNLDGTVKASLLFGGRDIDEVLVNATTEYQIKMELESYDNLIDGGLDDTGAKIVHIIDTKEERSNYQSLQLKDSLNKVKYCFLDIALTSEKPSSSNKS